MHICGGCTTTRRNAAHTIRAGGQAAAISAVTCTVDTACQREAPPRVPNENSLCPIQNYTISCNFPQSKATLQARSLSSPQHRSARTVVRCWPDITAHASHGDVVGEVGLYQRLPQARTMWRYSVHCVFAFQLGKLEVAYGSGQFACRCTHASHDMCMAWPDEPVGVQYFADGRRARTAAFRDQAEDLRRHVMGGVAAEATAEKMCAQV